MNEQIIILIFIVISLSATLRLYILKARNQIKYRGDERWQLIQLKACNAANIANGILVILLCILPLFINSPVTFTFQRVSVFGLIYLGIRNLIELTAVTYLDKQM